MTFAPRTTLHGSLADVYGVGLLFTGRSGIGKSECVLDLVERLKAADMLDSLELLHFHMGSQISNVRDIANGMREAVREMKRLMREARAA